MKGLGRNNKGFSLVELIIVIAIMAILVAIMAPFLLKYIEKSKVSTDLRSLDAVYQAVIYAMNDSNVVQDPDSQILINSLTAPVELSQLQSGAGVSAANTLFYEEIRDSLNWPDLSKARYQTIITSTHGGDAEIYIQYKGGVMNPIAMWITETDSTGNKCLDYDPTVWTELEDEPCIAIK